MIDKKNLIEDWWEEHGDDLVEAEWGGWSSNPYSYEVDPADYEGGEPPYLQKNVAVWLSK